jgi:hypothetical protein
VAATGEREWYFAAVDEEMYLQVLQRRVFEKILEFLEEHRVDTSEFELHQEHIVNNTHFGSVYNIGDVSGSKNVFGDKARVTHEQP